MAEGCLKGRGIPQSANEGRLSRNHACRTKKSVIGFPHCQKFKANHKNRDWEITMTQKMFIAKITPAGGGMGVEVTVPANDTFQARKMIESQYGPVKTWWKLPSQVH